MGKQIATLKDGTKIECTYAQWLKNQPWIILWETKTRKVSNWPFKDKEEKYDESIVGLKSEDVLRIERKEE